MNSQKYIFLLIVVMASTFSIPTKAQDKVKGGFTKGIHFNFVSFKQEGMPEGLLKTLAEAYAYDSLGNTIEELIYNDNGSINSQFVYKYDSKGNNLEFLSKDSVGNLIMSRIKEFNSAGKETKISDFDALGKLISSTTNGYDNKGNLINTEETEVTPKGDKITYITQFDNRIKIAEESFGYDSTGKLKGKRLKKFDKKGNIYEQNETDDQGNTYQTVTCEYNSSGAPVKITNRKKDGTVKLISVLKYDDKMNLIEIKRFAGDTLPDAQLFWKYDTDGNETVAAFFNSKGVIMDKRVRKFKAKGLMTEETIFKLGDSLGNKSTWAFDSTGRKIEAASYNYNGSLANKSQWKYDAKGNIIEESTFGKDGKENIVYSCKFNADGIKTEETYADIAGNKSVSKYDSYGNPTERFQISNKIPKKTDAWEYKK